MSDKTPKKESIKRVIPLRQAGITVTDNPERPSKLLFDEVLRHEQENVSEKAVTTEATLRTPRTSPTSPTKVTPRTLQKTDLNETAVKLTETSPLKDYQKVANSIVREAVPGGIFIGKSKLIYDCLYLLTRGAILPKRSVRIPKRLLMTKAGIGSERTLLKNLSHLKSYGLIKITEFEGQHEGNEYELFLPEEVSLNLTQGTPPTPPTPHHSDYSLQKVEGVPSPQSDVGGVSLNIENKKSYEKAKTLFKDYKYIDDETPLLEIITMLNDAAKRATGKDLSGGDFEALKEIVEIIISETDLARTRTSSVSVYLKLAAENLRRRLYARKTEPKNKSNFGGNPSEKNWVEIGKNHQADEYDEQGNYIPRPLDQKGREEALQILRDYQSWNAPIEDSKRFYTTEDWTWLMENISNE